MAGRQVKVQTLYRAILFFVLGLCSLKFRYVGSSFFCEFFVEILMCSIIGVKPLACCVAMSFSGREVRFLSPKYDHSIKDNSRAQNTIPERHVRSLCINQVHSWELPHWQFWHYMYIHFTKHHKELPIGQPPRHATLNNWSLIIRMFCLLEKLTIKVRTVPAPEPRLDVYSTNTVCHLLAHSICLIFGLFSLLNVLDA